VRQGVLRRQQRVREILHTLPPAAQQAILESFEETGASAGGQSVPVQGRHSGDETTAAFPTAKGR
jgi:phospholipid/cholesterol/gamma-HCH transport system ATP-binding protein